MSLDRRNQFDDIQYSMDRCADSLDEIRKQLDTVISLLRRIEKKKKK